jgi:hypothetical protein
VEESLDSLPRDRPTMRKDGEKFCVAQQTLDAYFVDLGAFRLTWQLPSHESSRA